MVTFDAFGCREVFTETVAEIDIKVFEAALALCVDLEVFVNDGPFLMMVAEDGVEVIEGIHLGFRLVQKSKLLVNDGEFSLGTDSFSLSHLRLVEFAFGWCLWISDDVNAEILAAGHLVGMRVPDLGIEIEIEGCLAAWIESLSESNFCCTHIFISFLICMTLLHLRLLLGSKQSCHA